MLRLLSGGGESAPSATTVAVSPPAVVGAGRAVGAGGLAVVAGGFPAGTRWGTLCASNVSFPSGVA